MTRRLLALAASAAVAGSLLAGAAPASACTMDSCPQGPFCPYVKQLCLRPF